VIVLDLRNLMKNIQNDSQKKFFTPQEVAKQLQLNTLTIYSYIKKKTLLAIKIGRNYRIAKEDLDKFIKSNKTY
jgi:excisionase family DNA binding protein